MNETDNMNSYELNFVSRFLQVIQEHHKKMEKMVFTLNFTFRYIEGVLFDWIIQSSKTVVIFIPMNFKFKLQIPV